MEIWNDIPEYKGLYQASNLGRIKSLRRATKFYNRWGTLVTKIISERILKLTTSASGYFTISFGDSTYLVSRLVAITFIPNESNRPCVNHINGIKSDNDVSNLEWCTYSENIQHAYDNSLLKAKIGSNKINAKVTESEVIEIKERHRNGERVVNLAKHYNLSQGATSSIVHRRSWKHI